MKSKGKREVPKLSLLENFQRMRWKLYFLAMQTTTMVYS